MSRVAIAFAISWTLLTQLADAQTESSNDELDYSPRTVLPFPLPAITDPPLVSAEKSNLSDNALVIGVVIDETPRAYPINQLTGPRREIINDELAGTAIAATW